MSIDLNAAVRTARTTSTEGEARGVITPNEARTILTQARGEGADESRLRRALGRAYEAPMATAIAGVGVGSIGLSAGTVAVRMTTTMTGGPGSIQLSISDFSGTPHMREQAFGRLVEQVYGMPRGTATAELLNHPALAAAHAAFMLAGESGSGNLRFPPALTRPPT